MMGKQVGLVTFATSWQLYVLDASSCKDTMIPCLMFIVGAIISIPSLIIGWLLSLLLNLLGFGALGPIAGTHNHLGR